MEYYDIPPGLYFQAIQEILKHFRPVSICIDDRINWGQELLNEKLTNKTLAIARTAGGLKILINGKEKFIYHITSVKKNGRISGKIWAIVYERFNADGVIHAAAGGYPNSVSPYTGPNDPRLPAITSSVLDSANRQCRIRITFIGKIPIKKVRRFPGLGGWNWNGKKRFAYQWTVNPVK